MKKIFLLFIAATLLACSSDTSDNERTDNFDRTAMMTNLADNLIIPSIENLDVLLDELVLTKDNFAAQPDLASLNELRINYVNAYTAWQHVEMYNIGKAEELGYNFQMNVYPTNVQDITVNISNGNYDLDAVNNNDAVGFPALDYMLYGLAGTDAEILEFYTTQVESSKHLSYLGDLIDRMKELTSIVLTDWRSSYRNDFVASTENNATSAINMMLNDYIFYFEKGLRANKIGIPAGVFSATPLPDRVEGFYSKIHSQSFARESLNAVTDFFNGTSAANPMGSTASLVGYINSLESDNLNPGQTSLSSAINTQFQLASDQLNVMDANLSQQVLTDNQAMTLTYDAMQRAVVLLKVDMLQILNISVDYVDADGD
jgi:predicted lipoprotein